MTAITTDLLPCPFCGGQPEFWNAREDVLLCTCLAGPEVHGSSKENAIAIWNRRADLSPSPEVVKELVEAAKDAIDALLYSAREIENLENVLSDYRNNWQDAETAAAGLRAVLAKLEGGE